MVMMSTYVDGASPNLPAALEFDMTVPDRLHDVVHRATARIAARHVGVVTGAIDLHRDSLATAGAGRHRLPDGEQPGAHTMF